MAKTAAIKLQTTDNYDMFKLSDFNRDIQRTKELERSMKEHGFIPAYPIHCVRGDAGKLCIKAGHHRFEVAKKLRIPLWYVIANDNISIVELERATTSWTLQDYLTSHVRAGQEASVKVKEYRDRTGIGIKQVVSMLGGESASSGNLQERFKKGDLEIKSTKLAEDVAFIVLGLKELGIKFATTHNLVSAICLLCFLEEFNMDVFMHRATNNVSMFHKCSLVQQYLEMLEGIYNHGARTKVNLAFLAKEAAKKRNAVEKSRQKAS